MIELELHNVDALYANQLDTFKFAQMLDDPSQCYKFYWLEAIMVLMKETDDDLSFDEIINEMICEAWHSVTKYHLHLGPIIKGNSENFLEHAIHIIEEDSELKDPVSKEDLMLAIKRNESSLKMDKKNLIVYVPYKLLSSFVGTKMVGGKRLIAYMEQFNKQCALPYTIIDGRGLQKKVRVNPAWKQLMLDNYAIIQSWIELKKIKFLQDRNPGVPGIIYKLKEDNDKDRQRKLGNARRLWKLSSTVSGKPLIDVYTGNNLDIANFDLDHFIPWSYVANDELWNLTPAERSINSSKSNHLPEWNRYFQGLVENQYYLYTMIFSYAEVRAQFEKCRKDNLNALWATETLFIENNSKEVFYNILEHNLKPIYESAALQGYSVWSRIV